jgi:hypothetical protein
MDLDHFDTADGIKPTKIAEVGAPTTMSDGLGRGRLRSDDRRRDDHDHRSSRELVPAEPAEPDKSPELTEPAKPQPNEFPGLAA